MRDRFIVALLLGPILLGFIMAGGWWLALILVFVLAQAAREYAALFAAKALQPATYFMVLGVAAITMARFLAGFVYDGLLLAGIVMLAMGLHAFAHERGRQQAALDFSVTLSGTVYLGLLGSFLVPLRGLPQGLWWSLLSILAIWLADTGAYFVGITFGRHKIAPRLSPHKSWEGYFGGIFLALLGTPLFALILRNWGLPDSAAFSVTNVAVLGLALAMMPPLGDFGASMLKRYVGVKDSGTLFPGHGGMLDRIDSWIWAFPLAYYLITLAF